jgi:transaldolase
MKKLSDLKIKIFADGADKKGMIELYKKPYIKGFTTNPTLMRKAGVRDYREFAREILKMIPDRPISFEVLADDFENMEKQALEINTWGKNVYVKIPVTNTKKESTYDLMKRLTEKGVKLNLTAIMTVEQVRNVVEAVKDTSSAFVSVFAGRIADTGRDPIPIMKECLEIMKPYKNIELLWASPRELFNIFQADEIGVHIITVTYDILAKMNMIGRSLDDLSLETVRMFYSDACKAGYKL